MSTVTSEFRKDSRLRMRRLNREKGVVSYYQPVDQKEVEFYLDELMKQHIIYGEEIKKGYSGFEYPAMVNFYKDLVKLTFAKNWLNLNVLSVNGEVAAIDLGFEYTNKYYPYMGIFKYEFFKYAVGRFLRLHVLRRAFARGLREFDLLIGNEPFDFNIKVRKLYCIALFRRSLRGYALEKWLL